jgi:hypothetical protein
LNREPRELREQNRGDLGQNLQNDQNNILNILSFCPMSWPWSRSPRSFAFGFVPQHQRPGTVAHNLLRDVLRELFDVTQDAAA